MDPIPTIIPFATLPSCAANCGVLFDANRACVPPVNPSGDQTACLCNFGALQPLKSGPADVCAGFCNSDPNGLNGIQGWYSNLCNAGGTTITSTTSTSSSTPTNSSTGSPSKPVGNNKGGGDWVSTHVNWIVFIVVVVVGIIGIWTGACIWRRKYLKKRNRLYELGKGMPSNVAVNTQGNLVGTNPRDSRLSEGPGMFMSGPGAAGTGEPGPQQNTWSRP